MPKQEFEYRLFYENNERANQLTQDDYEAYLELIDYMREQGFSVIDIDIYMETALNEFEKAFAKGKKVKNYIGKDMHAYVGRLKQNTDYKQQLQMRKEKETEGFFLSGVFMNISAIIVCYFFREILNDSYVLGFYIDFIISLVAAFFIAVGFYQHRKIIKRWSFTNNAFTVDSFLLIISFLLVYVMRNQAYDYSAFLLILSFIISTIIIKKEFKQIKVD